MTRRLCKHRKKCPEYERKDCYAHTQCGLKENMVGTHAE